MPAMLLGRRYARFFSCGREVAHRPLSTLSPKFQLIGLELGGRKWHRAQGSHYASGLFLR
jgi:hypothetical protein